MAYVRRQIFSDPTPHGSIQKRFVRTFGLMLSQSNFSTEEQRDFLDLVTRVALKLVAIWQHYHRFEEVEDRLIAEARASPINSDESAVANIATAQELYIEFDEFLVQIKSCLDHSVKMLPLVFGKNRFHAQSFGGRGKRVIRELKNTPKKWRSVANLISGLIEDQFHWFELAIEARDRINHFQRGGMDLETFTVFQRITDDQYELHVPPWTSDQSIREFMKVIWSNHFIFIEAFFGYCMMARMPGYALHRGETREPDDPTTVWTVITREAAEQWARDTDQTPKPV